MNNLITIRYFARFRERLGCEQEVLALSEDMYSLQPLRRLLAGRGPEWRELLGPDATRLMLAVNQELFDPAQDVILQPGDEVAFFPPVTGG
ncbi:MAG: molybdopterin converting factor subunit 1 [Perlucidibaca sp.]